MKVLSIDPGFERLGIAVIEKLKGEKEKLLFSECFETEKKLSFEKRLVLLGEHLEKILLEFSPDHLAIESLFLNTNQRTAMHVAEARGVIIYAGVKAGLQLFEYAPPQIKVAVAGNGRADKKAITKMIPLLLKIEKQIKRDDEYDAIAIGLAHLAIAHI